MFKVFNNNCPTYLQEYFHRTPEVHNYNLRGSNYDFQLPPPKTNFLERSFSYQGANAWNQLSNQIHEIRDLASFKRVISEDTLSSLGQIFTWLVLYYYIVNYDCY